MLAAFKEPSLLHVGSAESGLCGDELDFNREKCLSHNSENRLLMLWAWCCREGCPCRWVCRQLLSPCSLGWFPIKLYSALPAPWLGTPVTLHTRYPSASCAALRFPLDGGHGAEVYESSTTFLLGVDDSHAGSAGESWWQACASFSVCLVPFGTGKAVSRHELIAQPVQS